MIQVLVEVVKEFVVNDDAAAIMLSISFPVGWVVVLWSPIAAADSNCCC